MCSSMFEGQDVKCTEGFAGKENLRDMDGRSSWTKAALGQTPAGNTCGQDRTI